MCRTTNRYPTFSFFGVFGILGLRHCLLKGMFDVRSLW